MRDRLLGMALLLAIIAGCSGYQTYRQAKDSEATGNWDQAVIEYLELTEREPTNLSYRASLLRAKIRASQEHFKKGREFHKAGVLDRALVEYQQAVQLDPTNEYAAVELQKARDELAAIEANREPVLSLADLKKKTRGSRAQPPVLNPRSDEEISLDFPEAVSIFDIYSALGKAFGINILFDPALRDQTMAIELKDVTALSALETLMRASGQFYKVLDERSIIVAADTPQNRRKYEDLVIQTFFLSNADVKDVMTMLRSLIGARNIAQNEKLNAIVLRDTADKVKVAEKIISTNDKSRGEVIVDVELLQVASSRMRELGVELSTYSITQSLTPNPIPVSDLQFVNQGNWAVTVPSIIYNFMKNTTEAELLARPQLRISDGEKARLHIGDQVPIPVTTFNSSNTVGGNVVPITSFQYQDIGIRIDVEPRIHHNKEVTLTTTIEVSQIRGFQSGGEGGSDLPIIGTRVIESTVRLKDGETNFLAGLIRHDENVTQDAIPGISDIPVIGRLFKNERVERQSTDLVMTMTPRIIRTPDITEEDLLPIWVGTESNITFRGGSPRVESSVDGPFDEDEEGRDDDVREMIQRRLQNLPRGLEDTGQEGEEQQRRPDDLTRPGLPDGSFFEDEAVPAPGDLPDDSFFDDDSSNENSWLPDASPFAGGEADSVRPAAFADEGRKRSFQFAQLGRSAPIEVRLVTSSPSLAIGREFEVRLEVKAAAGISHLPAEISYDARKLEVIRVRRGDFLGGSGEAEVMSDISRPGRILLGASRLGRGPGVAGEGTVAVILFKALAAGPVAIDFARLSARDGELRTVGPVQQQSLSLQLGGAAPPQVRRRALEPKAKKI